MTRRSGGGAAPRPFLDELPRLAVLLVCFLCAGLAGCVIVRAAGESGLQSLSSYLHGYIELVREGSVSDVSIGGVIWELCRWPIFVIFLGMSALGAVAIPALFCVRGFLLGYSIASFVRVFGPHGLLAALAVFGMTALASVPVLFCVGGIAFSNALRLAAGVLDSRPAGLFPRQQLWALIPCCGLIALATALEVSAVPYLLTAIAGVLP